MKTFIDHAVDHYRAVILILVSIMAMGLYYYQTIPKESKPDIQIPVIIVSVRLEGISPEDAERLIVRPIEMEVQGIEGIKTMSGRAYLGGGQVTLEFKAGFNAAKAIADVRDKVDTAKAKLPLDADPPEIREVNLSLLPVLVVKLAGDIPQRTLFKLAKNLKEDIEARVTEVLSATIVGDREEAVEILIDPKRLQGYGLTMTQALGFLKANHVMISAGKLFMSQGEFSVKIPGLIEKAPELLAMPIAEVGGQVVTLGHVAQINRTYKDPETFARNGGKPAVAIEISKRTGENIIHTIQKVQAVVSQSQKQWPSTLQVSYSNDDSRRIVDMLTDLENQVLMAIFLVMIVVVWSLGLRSALLVGIAVPGAFLAGVLVLGLLGFTMNIVVLFALVLSVGMLVDGAIIVVEYADRKMIEGMDRVSAYKLASRRMLWPVLSSIGTIVVVFCPLLFWPGIVGQFMKFLPITLVATLSASILMALIFIPVLGALYGKVVEGQEAAHDTIRAMESGDLSQIKGVWGWYLKTLNAALDRPRQVVASALILLVGITVIFGKFGSGVEFFPKVDPDQAVVLVHARGNLSLGEKDDVMRHVESRILDMPEFASIYTRTGQGRESQDAEDVIGRIALEFIDWRHRPRVDPILQAVEKRLEGIPGVFIEIQQERPGPGKGKPIEIEVSSRTYAILLAETGKLRHRLDALEGLKNVEDNRPIPAIEWRLEVDREQAAKYKTNILEVGNLVRLATNGFLVGKYRPDDAIDEVDFLVRYPQEYRTLDQLDQILVTTPLGLVPISNFVKRTPAPNVANIYRVGGARVYTLRADVAKGYLADTLVQKIQADLEKNPLHADVRVDFRGEKEDQDEASSFLRNAFILSILAIVLIMVLQFNSFFSATLVVSGIAMSTIGVFLWLLLTFQPFGVVMGGIGVIALAGIIVSNNILVIDTYDQIAPQFPDKREAVLRAGLQRARPVILTHVTTLLGLLPIMLAISIDFFKPEITIGAPSTQWWIQLSSAIVSGMVFASALTLYVTPCALMAWENRRGKKGD